MAVTYGFYDSLNHDRLYNAQQMSAIFDGIINDGVFMSVGNQFHTVAGTGMQVIVKSGRAWFDSTWTLNDAEYPISIDAADVLLTRIDAVVLEVNSEVATRANTIKVVKGTPASTPAKPTLTNTATIHQHALAYVTVAKNTTAITNSMIEIVVGKTETPYVTAILQTTDITDLFNKWENDFQVWFETVKGTLDGDVALNLQNQIDHCVKKADKATSADIETGTANKWVDASSFRNEFNNFIKIGDIIPSTRNYIGDNYAYCNGETLDYIHHKTLYNTIDDFHSKNLADYINIYSYDNIYLPKYSDVAYEPSSYSAISNAVTNNSDSYYIINRYTHLDKNTGDIYYIVKTLLQRTSENTNHTWCIVIYKKESNKDYFVYDWLYSLDIYAKYSTSFFTNSIINGLMLVSITNTNDDTTTRFDRIAVIDIYNHTGKTISNIYGKPRFGWGSGRTCVIDDNSYILVSGYYYAYVQRTGTIPILKLGVGIYKDSKASGYLNEYVNGNLYTIPLYSPSGSNQTTNITLYTAKNIISSLSSSSFADVSEIQSSFTIYSKSGVYQPRRFLKYQNGIYYCDERQIYFVAGTDSLNVSNEKSLEYNCLPIIYIFKKDDVYYGIYWRSEYTHYTSPTSYYENGIVKIGSELNFNNIVNCKKNIISQGDTSAMIWNSTDIYLYNGIPIFQTVKQESPYDTNETFFGIKTPISDSMIHYFLKTN